MRIARKARKARTRKVQTYYVLVAYNGECCIRAHAALLRISAFNKAEAEKRISERLTSRGYDVNRDNVDAYTRREILS